MHQYPFPRGSSDAFLRFVGGARNPCGLSNFWRVFPLLLRPWILSMSRRVISKTGSSSPRVAWRVMSYLISSMYFAGLISPFSCIFSNFGGQTARAPSPDGPRYYGACRCSRFIPLGASRWYLGTRLRWCRVRRSSRSGRRFDCWGSSARAGYRASLAQVVRV